MSVGNGFYKNASKPKPLFLFIFSFFDVFEYGFLAVN
jgi:hypothetical protein